MNILSEILLDVQHLAHRFPLAPGRPVSALDDLSFQVRRGEIFGLVGESGCGKSTAARCVMGLLRPQKGRVLYRGIDVWDPKQLRRHRRLLHTARQLIFQDSASSLDPRMRVADLVAEPLAIHRVPPPRGTLRAEAEFQLRCVGLDASFLDKYPHQLSGGQRQRVAIARALSMEPELLAADEPTASLDVSVQAQILNLFRRLRQERGFTLLFISHDLPAVRCLCGRVGVMCRGRLVELAPAQELFDRPLHPFTRALVSAVLLPDPRRERARRPVPFDPESFSPEGELREVSPEHFVLWA